MSLVGVTTSKLSPSSRTVCQSVATVVKDSNENPGYSLANHSARLLPKKILKGPSELNAENLGAQHMK